MKYAIISILLLLVSGCHKESPTEATTKFQQGVWKGTFSDTTYYTPPQILIQTGTVTFTFAESSYHYSGSMIYSSVPGGKTPTSGQYAIADNGFYLVKGDKINLFDEANRRMVDWYPCLYLLGDYNYSITGRTMSIRESGSGRNQSLSITFQN